MVVLLTSIGSAATQIPPRPRAVAFTFDDLPATQSARLVVLQDLTARLLRVLVLEQIPAIGFVNESRLLVGDELDAAGAARGVA
jgi:hypothetical protein